MNIHNTDFTNLKTDAEISWKDFTESTCALQKWFSDFLDSDSHQNYWGIPRAFVYVGHILSMFTILENENKEKF